VVNSNSNLYISKHKILKNQPFTVTTEDHFKIYNCQNWKWRQCNWGIL